MEKTYIVLIVVMIDILIIAFFAYAYVKVKIKEARLEIAMDHYNLVNALKDDKKDLVSNKVKFEQVYPKTIKLFKQLEGTNGEERKEYYNNHVAQILGQELYKAGAIKIEYIQGIEEDKILGEVRYLIEV